jgi:glycosyltransferase involved in cell wall biosynthesis
MTEIGNRGAMVAPRQQRSEAPTEPGKRRGRVQWFGRKVASPMSLVLPMFNESAVVDVTLRRALETLDRDFADFEIVVADDASTDFSPNRVEAWTRRDPRIKMVRLLRNERFGGALRAGLDAASKEFLVYTDFDLPIALDALPRLLEEFAEADVLTGYSGDERKHVDWKHVVVSCGYNLMVRTLFGLRLRDINFGFKALRKSVWDRLELRSRSPFVDAELFIRAERVGGVIKSVPVPFVQRQLGVSHIRRTDVIAASLRDMARLRLALWRGL